MELFFFYLSSPTAGKTALLHALASSDGVQIHNTESIRLLLEGGEDKLPSAHKKPLQADSLYSSGCFPPNSFTFLIEQE